MYMYIYLSIYLSLSACAEAMLRDTKTSSLVWGFTPPRRPIPSTHPNAEPFPWPGLTEPSGFGLGSNLGFRV